MADDLPSPDYDSLCTGAITGLDYPTHQPIFVCDTCLLFENDGGGDDDDDNNKQPLPSCICQSCAETCHEGHEVYLVGVGSCTCDCPFMVSSNGNDDDGGVEAHKCKLAVHSGEEAQRLGFTQLRSLNVPIPLKVPPLLSESSTSFADAPNNDVNDDDEKEDNNKEENGRVANENVEDGISQSMSNVCIECHSSMGGYTYASYTLPTLVDDGGELCHNLIRQAEVLTDCSHDTFWVPDDDDTGNEEGNGKGGSKQWCDLELLAKQIYNRHVQSFSLQTKPNNETTGTTNPAAGGAEWWVQVKPAGMSRAPVDLHYDKDEVLAEKFGLGSFPTLSTVTYLTGENDNQPTVVFPHTYNDEEDRPIETMLLSHAVRAKHLVFDGRLLHGAPAHPAVLRPNVVNQQGNDPCVNEDAEGESSLRVTFLVNIWRSGRPAGVNILPESIREQIRFAATEATAFQQMTLEFEQRHISKLTVPAKSSMKSSVDNDGDDKTQQAKEERIILPFVSRGATWIGGDESEVDTRDGGEEETIEEDRGEEDVSTNAPDQDDSDEDDEEHEDDDEDDELVLVLSPFATSEYMEDKADTIVLSFENGNKAQLVRGAVDEMNVQDCPWKKLMAGNKPEGINEEERKKATVAKFLSYLAEHVPQFVASIVSELNSQCNMDVTELQADHVCYRTDSIEQYTYLIDALQSAGTENFTLLVESDIGGRPIATFKLAVPIESEYVNHAIDVIEIPSPKEGSPYNAGLEHVEFVAGDGTHKSPMNGEAHQKALKAWMEMYPHVSWNTKAIDKQCNPDVSTKLELGGDYGIASVKFHLIPLEDVIQFESGGV
ncbi:hypothetical protein ACHAXR_011376 [Thalassiosira sp. AJA248-18]